MKGKKIKFDSARLKSFFIEHGEKVALGVVLVLVGMMGWSAVKTPMYPKTPADLASQVASLNTEIVNKQWDRNRPDIPPIPQPPYSDQIKAGMTPVEPTEFAFPQPFNSPIRQNKVRRGEPTYYPPVELVTRFNRGAVETGGGAEGAGGASYVGQQWVVLTALVPVGQQQSEYDKLFDNAIYNEETLDTPSYVHFAIERRTLPDGKWEPVQVDEQISEALTKFALGEQVVETALKETAVCQPAFKLASGSHVGTLGHPPQIPEVQPIAQAAAAPPPEAPAARPGGNPLMNLGGQGHRPAGVVAGPAAPGANAEKAPATTPPYRLARFFDRSVLSNASYEYRMQLVVKNPNYEVPARYLAKPELAQGETRRTSWSEPSQAVKIDGDYTILASEAKPAGRLKEALATVGIVKWDLFQGTEVPMVFKDLSRGQQLNFVSAQADVPVPGKAEITKAAVDFLPNVVLLDFAGGESLMPPGGTKSVKSPSEMLFLSADGNLVIGQQVFDQQALSRHLNLLRVAVPQPEGMTPATGEAPSTPTGNSFEDLLKLNPK